MKQDTTIKFSFDFCQVFLKYLIGQNNVGQNSRWTSFSVRQNFCHVRKISPLLSDIVLSDKEAVFL